jgi:ATP-binding cassette, subfamily B, bacterial CvaB/MchF/RaxB
VTPWLLKLKARTLGRVPLLLQTEAAECGLMCVAMVAGYWGETPEVGYLRREHRISMRGASFEQLIRIAAVLKLSARALRVDTDALKQLPKPCILHWDEQHFVVLVSTNRRSVVIHDPAHGKRVMSWRKLAEHFSGAVLELTPTHEFTEARNVAPPKLKFWELTGKVVGLKKSLWQLFALGLGIETVVLVMPFFMQWVTDHAVVTGDRDLLIALVWGFASLLVIRTILEGVRSWAVAVMSTWFNVQWTANIFSHLLRLPVLYYQRRHMGDIVSRFGVIGQIQSTLTVSFVAAFLDGMMAVGTLAMLALYSLPLAGIVLAATLLYAAMRIALYQAQRRLSFESIVHGAKQESVFMETVRAMSTIRANSHEPVRLGHWMNMVVNTKNSQLQQQKFSIAFHTAQSALTGLAHFAVVGLGALAILEGKFSIGMLLAFTAYAQQFGARSSSLIDGIFSLRLLEVQGMRLLDIVHHKPEQDPSLALLPAMPLTNPLLVMSEFRFRYGEADSQVLAGVNLKIEPGQLLVIQGAPGCGKSTLVQALMGFFPIASGDIFLGGVAMRKMGLQNYRQHLGAVLADDKLLAGTVAENICLFAPDPDMDKIEDCARRVGLFDEINQLPMRFFTIVGDLGGALSSGQRQRLCLARALYRAPAFLILDEPLSQIGVQRRDVILQGLLASGIGVVMTAQLGDKPSCATHVVRMQAGKLVEVTA